MEGGKVHVPRSVLLSVTSENPIIGVTASRGYISSEDNINILVDDPILTICVNTSMALSVNEKRMSRDDLKRYSNMTDKFQDVVSEYYEKYFSGLNAPKILATKKGIEADFSGAVAETALYYELCDYSNILYLIAGKVLNVHDDAVKLIPDIDGKVIEYAPKKTERREDDLTRKIRDHLLDSITSQDIPGARKALSEWESYVKQRNRLKGYNDENKISKELKDQFNADSFDKNPDKSE
jgi:hypothetical protein